MPNKTQTHSGKSLRSRASTAARLTAQQQRERRERGRALMPAEEEAPKKGKPHGASHGKSRGKAGGSRGKPEQDKANKRTKPAKAATRRDTSSKTEFGKRRHVVALVIACAAVLLVAALYPIGRTYYQSLRDEQRYEAQLAAVNARNEALGKENEELNTEEGIEDAAREQGYVDPKDKAAVITDAGGAASSKLPGKVDVESIEAPHTWYYDLLDVIFFVNPGQD